MFFENVFVEYGFGLKIDIQTLTLLRIEAIFERNLGEGHAYILYALNA